MPALENTKHDNYARHRANGLLPPRAASAAGYVTGSAITTELENDPKIAERIQELLDERAARAEARKAAAMEAGRVVGQTVGMSHAWVLERLAQNAMDAASEGDFKESNSALKLIGEQLGMWGKAGADGTDGKTIPEAITDATMDRIEKLSEHLERFDPQKEIAIADQRDVDHLLGRGRNPQTQERELVTGSETDVALRDVNALVETLAATQPREAPASVPEIGETLAAGTAPQRRSRVAPLITAPGAAPQAPRPPAGPNVSRI